MSNQGKDGGQPVDDRTLLDPLNADELKALREARARLQGGVSGGQQPSGPPRGAGARHVGPHAGEEDLGDAPTRAMMAIPSFDSQRPKGNADRARVIAEPKPMTPGTKIPRTKSGSSVLSGTVPASQPPLPGQPMPPAGAPGGPGGPPPQPGQPQPPSGFGENTLMWMSPVKAPQATVDPRRGAAAGAGMIPTELPKETRARKIMTGLIGLLSVLLIVVVGWFIWPRGEPSVVELVTNPAKATVLIDGTATEVLTPMKATLPPGKHVIEVRLKGHRTETIDVTIVEGDKPSRRNIDLFPISKPGLMTISIEVQPISANITIDGKTYASRKVVRLPNVNPKKEHTLLVEAGGYKTIDTKIPAGQLKATYNYILERLPDEE